MFGYVALYMWSTTCTCGVPLTYMRHSVRTQQLAFGGTKKNCTPVRYLESTSPGKSTPARAYLAANIEATNGSAVLFCSGEVSNRVSDLPWSKHETQFIPLGVSFSFGLWTFRLLFPLLLLYRRVQSRYLAATYLTLPTAENSTCWVFSIALS